MNRAYPILIVTNEIDIQINLSGTLTEHEYPCLVANSIEQMHKYLGEYSIPLVLLSYVPEGDFGLEILRTIKTKSPSTECILLADQLEEKTAKEAIDLGAFSFFIKPFNNGKIMLTVKHVIDLFIAKQARDESDDQFKILFNKSGNPILVTDNEGNYLGGNAAACKFLECTPQELRCKNAGDFIPPETEWEDAYNNRQSLWEQGGTIETRYLINNQIKTLILSITPGHWQGQRAIYCLGIDITEQKIAKNKLIEREKFIQTVLDNLPIGIAVNSVFPNITFDYMNKSFPKLYRTTEDKLKKLDSFWEVVYEDAQFREKIKKRVLDDIASGDPERMDWQKIPIRRKGEKTRYISAKNVPLPNANLMISSVWDTTEQKLTEQALSKSEQKFKWLYDNAPIPYHILSADGRIEDVNQRWCDVLGYSKNEVIGKEVFDYIVEDERDSAKKSFHNKKIKSSIFY